MNYSGEFEKGDMIRILPKGFANVSIRIQHQGISRTYDIEFRDGQMSKGFVQPQFTNDLTALFNRTFSSSPFVIISKSSHEYRQSGDYYSFYVAKCLGQVPYVISFATRKYVHHFYVDNLQYLGQHEPTLDLLAAIEKLENNLFDPSIRL